MEDPIVPPPPPPPPPRRRDDSTSLEGYDDAVEYDEAEDSTNDNNMNDSGIESNNNNDNNNDTIRLNVLLGDGMSRIPLILPLIELPSDDDEDDDQMTVLIDVTVWELSQCLLQVIRTHSNNNNHHHHIHHHNHSDVMIAGLFRVSDGVFVPLNSILRHPFLFLNNHSHHHADNTDDDDYTNDAFLYCTSWPPPKPPSTTTNSKLSYKLMNVLIQQSSVVSNKQMLIAIPAILTFSLLYGNGTAKHHIQLVTDHLMDIIHHVQQIQSYEQFLQECILWPWQQALEILWYAPWRTIYRYGPSPLGWQGQSLLQICSSITTMGGDSDFWSRNPQECQTLFHSKQTAFLQYYTNPLLFLLLLYTIYHFLTTSTKTNQPTTKNYNMDDPSSPHYSTNYPVTTNLHHYFHFPSSQSYPIPPPPSSSHPSTTFSSSQHYANYHSAMNQHMYQDEFLQQQQQQYGRFRRRNIHSRQQQRRQRQPSLQ